MKPSTSFQTLRLKKREDRRIRAGHRWIYSNEVDVKITPLNAFEAGEQVVLEDYRGKPIAMATVNPASLICARIYTSNVPCALDLPFLISRIKNALSLRQLVFEKPYYRLIYAESDYLPGLVVDRFDDVLVVQITSAGMERIKQEVVEALDQVLKPTVILMRNDTTSRELEGLEQYIETAKGTLTDTITLEENQTQFEVPLTGGQKTGWYYDHRMNRQRLQAFAKDRTVLDVFSYVGAWGIQALNAGAKHVTCVDSSDKFLQHASHNAALNGREKEITTFKGDAFDVLKNLRHEQHHFDIVVLDPPAFIKRRKDAKEGLVAYQRINRAAMQLVNPGGLIISASCSWHLQREQLLDAMRKAAAINGQRLQILEQGHQGADHPVHPSMKETDYLKSYLGRITS